MSIEVETYETLGEAGRALGRDGRYLGGGTLVMRAVNYGDQSFRRIIIARDPGLKRITAAGERIEIGAGATMADIIASRDASFLAPVARQVGGPAIRIMATVGGNLFAAHPYGDFAAALLALDGRARMADGRDAPLDQLFAERTRGGGNGGGGGLVQSVSIARPR
ncbi:MAG: FAD binding domain-containing protein, partial [Paracoccaceae bacterium]